MLINVGNRIKLSQENFQIFLWQNFTIGSRSNVIFFSYSGGGRKMKQDRGKHYSTKPTLEEEIVSVIV